MTGIVPVAILKENRGPKTTRRESVLCQPRRPLPRPGSCELTGPDGAAAHCPLDGLSSGPLLLATGALSPCPSPPPTLSPNLVCLSGLLHTGVKRFPPVLFPAQAGAQGDGLPAEAD